jgi:hypothetical protein
LTTLGFEHRRILPVEEELEEELDAANLSAIAFGLVPLSLNQQL